MIDLPGVHAGMTVVDSNGDHLGTVGAVETTWQGGSGFDTTLIDADAGSTPNTYLRVTNGRTLWIPANQIMRVNPGQSVQVACETAACYDHYALRPPGLTEDSEPESFPS